MFEVAELGHKLSKKDFEERLPDLRTQLLLIQNELRSANFPVLILISGVDGAGKGETVNILNEWMDPRYLRAFAFGPASDEESERPAYWRFWRNLPPRGEIGLYVGSWYSKPIAERVNDITSDTDLDAELLRINGFEKALVDDGALIIKFWLHLSKDAQKKRLTALEKDPKTRWRVTKQDHKHLKLYDRFVSIAERALRETSTGEAPWIILEGSDNRYRHITVAQHVLERIRKRLDESQDRPPPTPHLRPIAAPEGTDPLTVLGALDMSQQLKKEDYKKSLAKYQADLGQLARRAIKQKHSTIILMEGWDAGGKGGLIRRIIPPLDARHYRIIPIAAPTDEERAHHYLWRFWRHIPRAGDFTIYDRSWYGRVLVERIEGFTHQEDWMRAYTEINDFEEQLTLHGIALIKFWLHITPEEQLRRFKEREQIPYKQYKITEEDYRNRERWEAYEHAVNDMVERTSTEYAPWHLIEGNDKRYARVKALQLVCERLGDVLGK